MNDQEIDQAISALQNWFISQGLSPKDAGIIMIKLIAEQFVLNDRDPDRLIGAIRTATTLLTFEVAGYLR